MFGYSGTTNRPLTRMNQRIPSPSLQYTAQGLSGSGLVDTAAPGLSGSGLVGHDLVHTTDVAREIDPTFTNGQLPVNRGEPPQNTPSTSRQQFTTNQILTLTMLTVVSLSSALFYSLLAPFFPQQAKDKGSSQTNISFIFAIFPLIGFIMAPIYGHFMMDIGSKFMLVAGILVTSSCAILFGSLEYCPPGTIYVIMCYCVRSVEALANTASSTASLAIAAQTFPGRISFVMGILQAGGCIGLLIGPLIGGGLFTLGGFKLPFFVTGGVYMLTGILALFALPPQKGQAEGGPEAEVGVSFRSRLTLCLVPIIPIVGLVNVAVQIIFGFLDVTLSLHLNETYCLRPAIIGVIFFIAPAVVVIVGPLVGWITDKYKSLQRPFLICGGFVGVSGILVMAPTPLLPFLPRGELWLLITGFCVCALGWACLVLLYNEYTQAASQNNFPQTMEIAGMLSGFYTAFGALGNFVGPTAGGWLYEQLGFEWACTIVAMFMAGTFTIYAVYVIAEHLCCTRNPRQVTTDDQETLIHEDSAAAYEGQ